ncbi:chromosomal replication initiator protein DnaA [Apilactobacillus micheneri]|uniref:Chromosomal replication initiator protein DnaA n=1 Tax=Apilactobacillus micheneri TaxID=1899430 RepID=A0A9Q8IMB9_9LACO|nr:chromosomal replication initiator protein DnaA [Apilactobacillus micheneri]TPR39991.1 chromosomal replication initiator protein DnaA [Apilactobacillus micheneri]TPR41802.1 chromosomal replication initiator protein DnaA [Apilactobacillus micheneri]TPR44193.1 chromosomal replication initiator protein DnaA [Apilactobacillus micheneri]TPR45817.1 chromosomal replication initiator protein DnaA [Apilactobacillus micheneri]TPR50561.1 chromosomal replication initiator protein DnaA [Apilactobacillus 
MNKDTLWEKIRDAFEDNVSTTTYSTWIETVKPVSLEGNQLTLELPSPLHRDYWKDKLADQLVEYAYKITKKDIIPNFVLEDELRNEKQSSFEPINDDQKNSNNLMKNTHLNTNYTFESFVIGKGNQMAHAAALVVSEDPGKMYNPLLLYGGVGLGKTHLMHAIGNKIIQDNPEANIKYITSESFTNDFINAIQNHKTESFRQEYRNVDVLLVDDIQFFADKDGTQEEFFHTFNDLYENRKQIVLTSDRLPNEISKLQDRLVSRFAWGLSVDITPPDLETRIAILKTKAEADNIDVPTDTLNYIAGQIDSNVRELEGALSRVQAFAKFKNVKITTDLVSDALKGLNKGENKIEVNIDKIIETVSSYFNLSIDDIKGKKRIQKIVIPRQIAMYLARIMTNNSLPKIGVAFGGKDHTTVIHAYDKISESLKDNVNLQNKVDELKEELKR